MLWPSTSVASPRPGPPSGPFVSSPECCATAPRKMASLSGTSLNTDRCLAPMPVCDETPADAWFPAPEPGDPSVLWSSSPVDVEPSFKYRCHTRASASLRKQRYLRSSLRTSAHSRLRCRKITCSISSRSRCIRRAFSDSCWRRTSDAELSLRPFLIVSALLPPLVVAAIAAAAPVAPAPAPAPAGIERLEWCSRVSANDRLLGAAACTTAPPAEDVVPCAASCRPLLAPALCGAGLVLPACCCCWSAPPAPVAASVLASMSAPDEAVMPSAFRSLRVNFAVSAACFVVTISSYSVLKYEPTIEIGSFGAGRQSVVEEC